MYKVINIAESSWWPEPSAYITPRNTAWPGITIHIITIDAFICGFAKTVFIVIIRYHNSNIPLEQNKKHGWTQPVPNSLGNSHFS